MLTPPVTLDEMRASMGMIYTNFHDLEGPIVPRGWTNRTTMHMSTIENTSAAKPVIIAEEEEKETNY